MSTVILLGLIVAYHALEVQVLYLQKKNTYFLHYFYILNDFILDNTICCIVPGMPINSVIL